MRTTQASILAVLFFTVLSSGCGGSSDNPSPPQIQQTIVEQEVSNMPAGFQVIGSHGAVQIDADYFNLGFISKGTVNTTGPAFSNAAPTVTVTGNTPILCIRSNTVTASIVRVTKSGNQYTYRISGNAAGAIDWFLFDKMQGSGNAGMQVFNANGEVVFDASARPMRVVSIYQINDGDTKTGTTSLLLPANGLYAACISQGRKWGVSTANSIEEYTDGVLMATNAEVRGIIKTRNTSKPTSQPVIPATSGGQILIVNVAGL
jgi:hypothetical protein